jgi:hypothetical protein
MHQLKVHGRVEAGGLHALAQDHVDDRRRR